MKNPTDRSMMPLALTTLGSGILSGAPRADFSVLGPSVQNAMQLLFQGREQERQRRIQEEQLSLQRESTGLLNEGRRAQLEQERAGVVRSEMEDRAAKATQEGLRKSLGGELQIMLGEGLVDPQSALAFSLRRQAEMGDEEGFNRLAGEIRQRLAGQEQSDLEFDRQKELLGIRDKQLRGREELRNKPTSSDITPTSVFSALDRAYRVNLTTLVKAHTNVAGIMDAPLEQLQAQAMEKAKVQVRDELNTLGKLGPYQEHLGGPSGPGSGIAISQEEVDAVSQSISAVGEEATRSGLEARGVSPEKIDELIRRASGAGSP